ncbi:MAG: tyrosinase family protein [Pyrinomonadaceae bacterium]
MDDLFSNGNVGRRVFVKGLGFISLAMLIGTYGGCETACEQIKKRPTRRRLRTGSPEVDADIATYRDAVAAMKALPAADKRSWAFQAGIHGTGGGGFNLCQHGTDHFFSWHRAYLFYLEKICQELTGNKNFGLPYWNWNQDPAIHTAYLDPASSLFQTRTRTTVAGHNAFTTATLDPFFTDTNFFTFSSQIEGTPHNSAHGWIGGIMGGGGSAGDPIFYGHHNMVDYCWAKWNIELGNSNTNDNAWNSTSWNHFVDGQGNPVEVTAGATTLMPLLSYQFESSAIGSNAAKAEATGAEFDKLEKRIRAGADVKFDIKKRIPIAERTSVKVAEPFTKPTRLIPEDFAALINSDKEKEKVFVSIKYAQLPPSSDFYIRVFINMPTATAATPIEDPHYAGSFAFFGTHIEGAHHEHKPEFLVNITETLQRLKQRNELNEKTPVHVNLVVIPHGDRLEKQDAELILEKVEIIVTPVIPKTVE